MSVKLDYTIVNRTRAEAIAVLKLRYAETCDRYPITREIPEAVYVKRNLRAAMKYAAPAIDGCEELRDAALAGGRGEK